MTDAEKTQIYSGAGSVSERKHTPLPWKVAEEPLDDHRLTIFSYSDSEIAPAVAGGDNPEERDATAAFIVLACNSHYKLVEALQECVTDCWDTMESRSRRIYYISDLARAAIADATA